MSNRATNPIDREPMVAPERKKDRVTPMELKKLEVAPSKKPRQDQEEMYKLINKRTKTTEKEIEHGKKAYLLMQKMEKSLEELQSTFKTELMKHGAGLHADTKKGFEKNHGSHQRAGHEIHATNRKVDGFVADSAVLKADLTRIKVLVEDSRQLWLTKMAGIPKPDYSSSPREESSSYWGTPGYNDPIHEIEPSQGEREPSSKTVPSNHAKFAHSVEAIPISPKSARKDPVGGSEDKSSSTEDSAPSATRSTRRGKSAQEMVNNARRVAPCIHWTRPRLYTTAPFATTCTWVRRSKHSIASKHPLEWLVAQEKRSQDEDVDVDVDAVSTTESTSEGGESTTQMAIEPVNLVVNYYCCFLSNCC
ncbi:hypothetical protein L5515_010531 [Caenorhabditis briggsae]|uniref:Uncharacterized protein n=1 Tax=Caenorhabditis briggsae TaxID=6238 RepID=A0AAE9ESA7_CAEBR|nr:hypothetical protein L5515_010531 [Caenorhabditis briggsae]